MKQFWSYIYIYISNGRVYHTIYNFHSNYHYLYLWLAEAELLRDQVAPATLKCLRIRIIPLYYMYIYKTCNEIISYFIKNYLLIFFLILLRFYNLQWDDLQLLYNLVNNINFIELIIFVQDIHVTFFCFLFLT